MWPNCYPGFHPGLLHYAPTALWLDALRAELAFHLGAKKWFLPQHHFVRFHFVNLWRYDALIMAMTVKLRDVVEAMDSLMEESAAYLNKRTGELFTLSHEELSAVEDEAMEEELAGTEAGAAETDGDLTIDSDFSGAEDLDDDPEWLRESKLKAREIINSDEWTQLPSKFDIHEYHIMEEFGRSIEDPELRDNLLHAIRGSGAFGRFRYALDTFGLREAWFEFRAA
ncbi:MAG: hypothetical protein ACREA9_28300 [Pyrinomonadaceae bacterium]